MLLSITDNNALIRGVFTEEGQKKCDHVTNKETIERSHHTLCICSHKVHGLTKPAWTEERVADPTRPTVLRPT